MYEFNMTLDLPFDTAMTQVRDALAAENLGIVSEVDVQALFASKLEKSIPSYRILGACNPKLADRVMSAEPNAGVLLPCNVVLRAQDENTTVVSFLDPIAVLGMTTSEEPKVVAREARGILERVMAKLSA